MELSENKIPLDKGINQNIPNKKSKQPVGVGVHLFLLLCITLCGTFGVWAYHSELDIVSVAEGRVAPSSKVKSVQHLEGGIVKEILVKEGDRVKPEQALVILETTVSGANVEELQVRINALQVDVARLQAVAAGLDTIDHRISSDYFYIRLRTEKGVVIKLITQFFTNCPAIVLAGART